VGLKIERACLAARSPVPAVAAPARQVEGWQAFRPIEREREREREREAQRGAIRSACFTEIDAGATLSPYAALSLSFALLVAGLTMRTRRPAVIAVVAGISIVFGNTMLAIAPTVDSRHRHLGPHRRSWHGSLPVVYPADIATFAN
jgi:hypothetical protein